MTIGYRPACTTCRTLHTREDAPKACHEQLEADVSLLNSHAVHITGHGYGQEGIGRETIHALAAVVRLVLKMAAPPSPAHRWRGGPR